jgi:hypothetical protein
MHVHRQDVHALREQVDADNLAKPSAPELVQLNSISAPDAQDGCMPAAQRCSGDSLDQKASADAGIVVALRERSLKLHPQVIAVVR